MPSLVTLFWIAALLAVSGWATVGWLWLRRRGTSRQAQIDLRDSEALYHSLVSNLPLSIWRKDLQGRFTFGNQLFCQKMNKTLEEIMGRTDFDFFPSALSEKYARDDRWVAENRQVWEDVE